LLPLSGTLRHGLRRGRLVGHSGGSPYALIPFTIAHAELRHLAGLAARSHSCRRRRAGSEQRADQTISPDRQGDQERASPQKRYNTLRLTLSDGAITHDAHFQPINEHAMVKELASGRTEMNFVDSYKYNIAAYELAALVGLDDMVPVYVERRFEGKTGSFGWWLPVKMDEADRLKQKIPVPDPDSWNKQMYRVRVLDQLAYDTDANLTNLQIGEDWKIYRIDFSRAFRPYKDLQSAKDLVQCDRQLFTRLKALDADQLATKTKGLLSKQEVQAVMARRDKIVDHFQTLIAEKGENEVLY
jgi:hypothetical protein